MTRKGTRLVGVCWTLFALLLVVPMQAEEGGATLEELIEKCKGVTTMADFVPLIHPDDRLTLGSAATMVGGMVMMNQSATEVPDGDEAKVAEVVARLEKEYLAIEERHGVTPMEEMEEVAMEDRGAAMFGDVDIQAFVADVEAWMTEVTGTTSKEAGMMPDFSLLGPINEDGDTATADMGGQPMSFARIDGRWYVRLGF